MLGCRERHCHSPSLPPTRFASTFSSHFAAFTVDLPSRRALARSKTVVDIDRTVFQEITEEIFGLVALAGARAVQRLVRGDDHRLFVPGDALRRDAEGEAVRRGPRFIFTGRSRLRPGFSASAQTCHAMRAAATNAMLPMLR